MKLETMLDRAINSKNITVPYLDELISFLPRVCSHEAVPIVQTALSFFRNCSDHLTDFFTVEGYGRRVLINNIQGEQVFFSSDIRKPRGDGSPAPHNRIFMSVSFLDEEVVEEPHERLSRNPQELMHEHARRYQCVDSDFLYAVLGLIHGVQHQHYTFIASHEAEKGELILVFRSVTNKYKAISIMLNFNVMLMDQDLLEAYGIDESQIMLISDEDVLDKFAIRDQVYLH